MEVESVIANGRIATHRVANERFLDNEQIIPRSLAVVGRWGREFAARGQTKRFGRGADDDDVVVVMVVVVVVVAPEIQRRGSASSA